MGSNCAGTLACPFMSLCQEVRHLLKKLVERCEWYLHRYIHRVMHCPQWGQLASDLQQELLQSEYPSLEVITTSTVSSTVSPAGPAHLRSAARTSAE